MPIGKESIGSSINKPPEITLLITATASREEGVWSVCKSSAIPTLWTGS